MKKILFPSTNRVHESRQKLLLDKLGQHFEVHITTYSEKDMNMSEIALDIANKFPKALEIKPDLVLIRADRFELLPIAMLCAYNGIPIAQIEAGDLSGVIDNKVRYAISHLSDYHFATNKEAEQRLKNMRFKQVFNVGSLDIEYAMSVRGSRIANRPYILVLYHVIEGEDETELLEALKSFPEYEIIGLKGNRDYGKSLYTESYAPDEFIRLLRGATCLVGNSSAGLKEASVLGIPVVNIGERQANRLRTFNVLDTHCSKAFIELAIKRQLGRKYDQDYTYFQKDTSNKITDIITEILS